MPYGLKLSLAWLGLDYGTICNLCAEGKEFVSCALPTVPWVFWCLHWYAHTSLLRPCSSWAWVQLAERCRAYLFLPSGSTFVTASCSSRLFFALLSYAASYCLCSLYWLRPIVAYSLARTWVTCAWAKSFASTIIKSYDGAVIFCLFLKSSFL